MQRLIWTPGWTLAGVLALACQSESAVSSRGPAPEGSATDHAEPAYRTYGAPLTGGVKADLATLLKEPERFEGKTVVVEGDVRKACSRKGCWMELSTGADSATPGCRVTFKDYGFFVPTDSAGAKARVLGQVTVERVPERHVEHLESEGAKFENKDDDGSAKEVRLVATGVELKKS